ncbi:MAG: general stress protein [Thermodesulfobacteriota bacterium]|nr:general stress protein [Thermodesulfobacteriota bacterium]
MKESDLAVAVYNTHTEAEEAVKKLEKAGFDMKKLSIVGRDYHSEEHVVCYYNVGDRMKAWGKLGAFWGGLWGILFGAAFFIIPGIGPIAVAGPFARALVGAPAGLVGIGIPKGSVIRTRPHLRQTSSCFWLTARRMMWPGPQTLSEPLALWSLPYIPPEAPQ